MKFLKLPIFVVLSFLFSACTTTDGYKIKVDKYLGVSESTLISDWGVPDKSYKMGKVKYLEYSKSKTYSSSYQTNVYNGTAYTRRIGGGTFNCVTTFKIQNKRVTNWSAKGDLCRD